MPHHHHTPLQKTQIAIQKRKNQDPLVSKEAGRDLETNTDIETDQEMSTEVETVQRMEVNDQEIEIEKENTDHTGLIIKAPVHPRRNLSQKK